MRKKLTGFGSDFMNLITRMGERDRDHQQLGMCGGFDVPRKLAEDDFHGMCHGSSCQLAQQSAPGQYLKRS